MNLIMSADWPLHYVVDGVEIYDHREFLQGFVRDTFEAVRRRVLNPVLRPRDIPTWGAEAWERIAFNAANPMRVHLHAGPFAHGAVNVSGLYTPALNRLDVDWNLEGIPDAESGRIGGHKIMRHEMQHALGYLAGLSYWAELGHGSIADPFRQLQTERDDFVYHGDVQRRHVSEPPWTCGCCHTA
jgi:hypothetical protein